MIGMMSAIVLLCTMQYWTAKPNYESEATPERIAELEEQFELNRDNAKIRQMNRT